MNSILTGFPCILKLIILGNSLVRSAFTNIFAISKVEQAAIYGRSLTGNPTTLVMKLRHSQENMFIGTFFRCTHSGTDSSSAGVASMFGCHFETTIGMFAILHIPRLKIRSFAELFVTLNFIILELISYTSILCDESPNFQILFRITCTFATCGASSKNLPIRKSSHRGDDSSITSAGTSTICSPSISERCSSYFFKTFFSCATETHELPNRAGGSGIPQ